MIKEIYCGLAWLSLIVETPSYACDDFGTLPRFEEANAGGEKMRALNVALTAGPKPIAGDSLWHTSMERAHGFHVNGGGHNEVDGLLTTLLARADVMFNESACSVTMYIFPSS